MALHTVSNAVELSAGIRSTSDGDTIVLKAGHYGQLNIANSSKALTITSESVSSPATFAGIQVHTASGASNNVLICDNVFDSNDLNTYGITFFGGALHRNVMIDNNKVIGGHHHGITVESANGLRITNNVVLKDIANTSTRDVNLPKINVSPKASDVQTTGNIAYKITGAIGSANTLVSTKVTFSADGTIAIPIPTPPSSGDIFRFDGDDVRGWTRAMVRDLDFSEENALEFVDYRLDTFTGDAGFGSTAVVDSASDLRSLIASSSAVTGHD